MEDVWRASLTRVCIFGVLVYILFWKSLCVDAGVPALCDSARISINNYETKTRSVASFCRTTEEGFSMNGAQRWCWGALEAKPPAVRATFVWAPWWQIIQDFLRTGGRLAVQTFARRSFYNGVAIVSHDKFERALPLFRKLGINRIFTPSAKRGVRCAGIEVIPILFNPLVKTSPARHKDILYSFVGSPAYPIRKAVFGLSRRDDVVLINRENRFFRLSSQARTSLTAEFADILSRSRFALCPAGATPLTFRISESLWAGAIPVIIADNLELPCGVDWEDLVVCTKEKDVKSLDRIIRNISPEREKKMRDACLALARTLEQDPAYFIRAYFSK